MSSCGSKGVSIVLGGNYYNNGRLKFGQNHMVPASME